jgi:hypothetical protein
VAALRCMPTPRTIRGRSGDRHGPGVGRTTASGRRPPAGHSSGAASAFTS